MKGPSTAKTLRRLLHALDSTIVKIVSIYMYVRGVLRMCVCACVANTGKEQIEDQHQWVQDAGEGQYIAGVHDLCAQCLFLQRCGTAPRKHLGRLRARYAPLVSGRGEGVEDSTRSKLLWKRPLRRVGGDLGASLTNSPDPLYRTTLSPFLPHHFCRDRVTDRMAAIRRD